MQALKPIKTEEDHQAYLAEIQALIALDSQPGTAAEDRLEVITVLVESYEKGKFPIETPDPIDAIHFRMAEKGLKQADLIPYFGTRSRVSEVLARKRPLTVQMIRALSLGLGISAETLVGLGVAPRRQSSETVDWSRFPLKEMVARGWIRKIASSATVEASELVKEFVSTLGHDFGTPAFRRTLAGEANSPTTTWALFAWLARIIQKSRLSKQRLGAFDEKNFSVDFLRELAQLSWFDRGPLLAVEFLEKHGIAVVFEPQLRGTMLDGAALLDADSTPIVALTLRHDRLDNFWFSLVHEVVHIWKHVRDEDVFLDDLDSPSEDKREAEANRIARDALIPRVPWKRSDAHLSPSRESIEQFAREMKIHPAIVAGRVRWETSDYTRFQEFLGLNQARSILADYFT